MSVARWHGLSRQMKQRLAGFREGLEKLGWSERGNSRSLTALKPWVAVPPAPTASLHRSVHARLSHARASHPRAAPRRTLGAQLADGKDRPRGDRPVDLASKRVVTRESSSRGDHAHPWRYAAHSASLLVAHRPSSGVGDIRTECSDRLRPALGADRPHRGRRLHNAGVGDHLRPACAG